jgi:hypothetical protein
VVTDMGVGLWVVALLAIVIVLFGWVALVLAAGSRRFNKPRPPRNETPHRGDGGGGGIIMGDRGSTNIYGR